MSALEELAAAILDNRVSFDVERNQYSGSILAYRIIVDPPREAVQNSEHVVK